MRERKHVTKETSLGSDPEMFSYSNPHHQNLVMESLYQLYKSQSLCDVTLIAEDQQIKAHRAVLAACSPYFYTMFTGSLKESQQEVIEIQNITFLSLDKIVLFCYTSAIEVPTENVFELLTAADMLQFSVIKESVSAYLSGKLTPMNCIELSMFADIHSCKLLKEFSVKYAKEHFRKVTTTEAFLEADLEQVNDLLRSDSLGITTEKDVFEAAVSWVKYDLEKRRDSLSSLVSLVRLQQLSPKVLVDCVEREPIVADNNDCMRMINAAKTYHLIPDWTATTTGNELQARSIHRESKLYVMGGEVHQKIFNSLEVYSFSNSKWTTLQGMHKARDGVGVTTYDGKIYAVGGCDGNNALCCAEMYNPDTNTWAFCSSMNEPRHALSMTEHNGWLYALGGSDFTTSEYSSVEKYDPIRDNWSFLPHMHAKREGLVSVSLEGSVYAMGGDNGVSILNTVERFDPRTGKWYFSAPMGYRRRYFGGTILNGIVYVAGGSDYDEDLNSIECFDPRTNRWQFLPSMATRRESVAVAALGGKILAIGGACMNKETNTVEVYDPLLNKWDVFTPMVKPKEGMGVAVI